MAEQVLHFGDGNLVDFQPAARGVVPQIVKMQVANLRALQGEAPRRLDGTEAFPDLVAEYVVVGPPKAGGRRLSCEPAGRTTNADAQ